MTHIRETAQLFGKAFGAALKGPFVPVLWLVGSGLCIAAGPFETMIAFDLAERFAFWPIAVGLSVVVGCAVRTFVHGVLRPPNIVIAQTVVALLVALFLGPLLTGLVALFIKEGETGPGLLQMMGNVLVVSGVVSAIIMAVSAQRAPPAPAPALADGTGPRLMTRISPALRAPIRRMQVRDHYVEVVTGKGSEMVLIRFADALTEIAGAEGLQVHRSHWVAREAMTGLVRYRGRTLLLLCDGTSVPVSRTHLPAVEALDLNARTRAAAE